MNRSIVNEGKNMLKCIYCLSILEKKEKGYICQNGGKAFLIENGILSFLNEEYQEQHFPRSSFEDFTKMRKIISDFELETLSSGRLFNITYPFNRELLKLDVVQDLFQNI
jgi:hypothetical protein